MPLAPGTMVSANVRLVRPLAKGGMGQVWVADHLTLRLQVAVKFLADHIDEGDEAARRFAEEASTAARIKSPFIVQTHDCGVTEDGTPFMVMELLDGEPLVDRLERLEHLDPAQVTRIVHQVARALDRAHRLGVVHCDIKAENIFLVEGDDELTVKVFDFGIARWMSQPRRQEDATTLEGSPPYLSPERFLDHAVDAASDVWALAVTAYLCLTGHFPFLAADFEELGRKVVTGDAPPPSTVRRDLPRSVDEVFQKAFAPKLQDRYATAKELAVGLAAGLGAATPDSILDESSWDGTMALTPERRWPARAFGVAVLGGVAVAAVAFWSTSQGLEPGANVAPAGAPALVESSAESAADAPPSDPEVEPKGAASNSVDVPAGASTEAEQPPAPTRPAMGAASSVADPPSDAPSAKPAADEDAWMLPPPPAAAAPKNEGEDYGF